MCRESPCAPATMRSAGHDGVLAGRCRMKSARGAVEQLELKIILHLLDQEADRGLGHAQLRCGLSDAAEAIDQDQGLELPHGRDHKMT